MTLSKAGETLSATIFWMVWRLVARVCSHFVNIWSMSWRGSEKVGKLTRPVSLLPSHSEIASRHRPVMSNLNRSACTSRTGTDPSAMVTLPIVRTYSLPCSFPHSSSSSLHSMVCLYPSRQAASIASKPRRTIFRNDARESALWANRRCEEEDDDGQGKEPVRRCRSRPGSETCRVWGGSEGVEERRQGKVDNAGCGSFVFAAAMGLAKGLTLVMVSWGRLIADV